APCKTFAGAISKTAVNGEINCLDPGGFGAVTITKSITIDCHEVFASILNASTNGININFSSFAGTDTRKTVRLRNLNFNGADTGLVGVNITASNTANTKVFIEDCLIDGNFAGNARGIFDQRTGTNAQLSISNTTIRNMGSSGISVIGSANTKVSINNSKIANCVLGMAAVGGPKVSIFDSVFTSNTTGIQAEPSGTEINVDQCIVSSNGTGFIGNSTIRVANTTAANNGTLSTGTVSSYGNNRTGGVAFSGAPTGQN
ncbi:TPA: hypothetical protein ACP9FK_002884, partial [Legionella anisa]